MTLTSLFYDKNYKNARCFVFSISKWYDSNHKQANKSTRKSAAATDHILTNTFVHRTFKSSIFITDVSDNLLVIFVIPSVKLSNKDEMSYIYKRFVTDETIAVFNNCLYQNKSKEILELENEAYPTFLYTFS